MNAFANAMNEDLPVVSATADGNASCPECDSLCIRAIESNSKLATVFCKTCQHEFRVIQ